MKKFVSAFVVLTLFAAAPAWGQRVTPSKTQPGASPAIVTPPALLTPPVSVTPPATVTPPVTVAPPATVLPPAITQPTVSTANGELKATPEMWFYEQYVREYKDPKNAVRANAEFAMQQRANRLAAMRWFGLSNSRPRVGADPVNVYPPAWASNTPLQPNRWQATGGQPYYVARPELGEFRSY